MGKEWIILALLFVALTSVRTQIVEEDDLCGQLDGIAACSTNCEEDSDCTNTTGGQCCSYAGDCNLCRYPEAKICTVGKEQYMPGTEFPASDGCNMCNCTEAGVPECTKEICFDPCIINDVTHQTGEKFVHEDGCNTCECDHGEVTCTNKTCTCEDGEIFRDHGEIFRSADDCNTCSCNKGVISCTEQACDAICVNGARTELNRT